MGSDQRPARAAGFRPGRTPQPAGRPGNYL